MGSVFRWVGFGRRDDVIAEWNLRVCEYAGSMDVFVVEGNWNCLIIKILNTLL